MVSKKTIILSAVVLLAAVRCRDACAQDAFRTRGAVAGAALQVGCWNSPGHPLAIKTPDWIFPMPQHQWPKAHQQQITVKEYAQKFIDDIKQAPRNRPVWLMLHGWFGGYRPGWDKGNVLAHAEDATAGGTPGIWPEKGVGIWIERNREFLGYFRAEGIPIDFIPLDHETTCQQWAGNFSPSYTFRNIVRDPRWKTKEVPGTGLKGVQLFDPAELDREEGVWRRTFLWDEGRTRSEDSLMAYRHVRVIAAQMPKTILQKAFVESTHAVYPDTVVSDYHKTYWPLADRLYHGENEPDREIWDRLFALNPELKSSKQLGDVASPPFYGQEFWQKYHAGAKNPVDGMLAEADGLIGHAGGDGKKLVPWISLPNYQDRKTKKRIAPDEYERLICGLVERGVRHFILWFARQDNTPEAGREFLGVIERAYRTADELDAKKRERLPERGE